MPTIPLSKRIFLILDVDDLWRHGEKDAYVISREALLTSNLKIREFFTNFIDDALAENPRVAQTTDDLKTAIAKKVKSNEQRVLYGPGNRVIDFQD